jgi:putative hydrolase of the HAD superfamily
LHKHFADHVLIESMVVHRQLRPKPSPWLLRRLLASRGLSPRRCVLVEDSLENLKSARALGIRTVWLTGYTRGTRHRPDFVDVKVKSLNQLARQRRKLGAG